MTEKEFQRMLEKNEIETLGRERELEVIELLDRILGTNGEIDEDIKWDDYDLITTMFDDLGTSVFDKYVNNNKLDYEQRCMIYEYMGKVLKDCTNVIMRDTVRSQDNMQQLMLLLLHIILSELQDGEEIDDEGISSIEEIIEDIDNNPYDIDRYDYYTHLLVGTFLETEDEEDEFSED